VNIHFLMLFALHAEHSYWQPDAHKSKNNVALLCVNIKKKLPIVRVKISYGPKLHISMTAKYNFRKVYDHETYKSILGTN